MKGFSKDRLDLSWRGGTPMGKSARVLSFGREMIRIQHTYKSHP